MKSDLVNVEVLADKSNYTKGRSKEIEKITIHHMAGILTAEECGAIFQKANRNGSSNYGIGNDGKIGLYVREDDTPWTDGNWDSNCKSITIETSNSQLNGDWLVSDEAINSLIKLVADIAKRYNLGKLEKGKNLTWHSMYANTACPGKYLLSKIDYICDEANKINFEKTKPEEVKNDELKLTDKVVPLKLIDYNGTPLVQYDDIYEVYEINGDRVVLAADRNGKLVIWAAMNIKDIKKVE